MEEKKKSNKGLIVLVVVLLIIILGLIGYICYDKGVLDGLLGKDKTVEEPIISEEPKQEEKLSEEEVMKLHDSLIAGNEYGLYFKDSVTIDTIKGRDFLPYVLVNYADDKNITNVDYNLQCFLSSDDIRKLHIEDECNSKERVSISKTVIDNYIKDNYNTTRNFMFESEKDDDFLKGRMLNTDNLCGFIYSDSEKEYYYGYFPGGQLKEQVYHKLLKYEQEGDNLYIYDNSFVCTLGQTVYCFSNMSYVLSGNNSYFINHTIKNSSEKLPPYLNRDINDAWNIFINEDYIYENMKDKLNTYKITFKKGNDGKYYWYSSEIVNE